MPLKTTTIPFNKRKLSFLLAGSVIFVLIGVWIIVAQPDTGNTLFNLPFIKYGAALASIIFFGAGSVYFIKRLSDSRPALIIDAEGFTDNSSLIAAGFVPWSDVTLISVAQRSNQLFLLVYVRDTAQYLNRKRGFWAKKSMNYNLRHYGTPVAIATAAIKMPVGEIMEVLEEYLKATRDDLSQGK